jgi:hypothetical protein
MIFRSLGRIVPILLFFSACTTTSKVTCTADLSQLPANVVGAVFPYSIESFGLSGRKGCEITLRKGNSFKKYDVRFELGSGLLFAALPPGTYTFYEFSCGGLEWDLTFESFPGFPVSENSISFLPGLWIKVTESDVAQFKMSNREMEREELLRFLGEISPSIKGRVVPNFSTPK